MVHVLQVAMVLAAQGLPVFPCSKTKRPSIPKADPNGRGFRAATIDQTQIRLMFDRTNAVLVGVPTGQASGFDVLDLDYRNGATEWEEENSHRLPETRTHQTMSGGRHLLFRHVDGVRNSASKKTLANGIDVRGDGGYVIFPPSAGYTVVHDVEIAEWPDWLLELVLRHAAAEDRVSRPAGYKSPEISSKRLDGLSKAIIGRVASAPDGAKHYTLRNAALSLGGIQEAANLSDSDAVKMLLNALNGSVQDWKVAEETALWGLKNGRLKPLELSDRPGYTPPRPVEGTTEPINGHAAKLPPPVEQPGRPAICVYSGLRHEAADLGLSAMAKAGVPFYQRDRQMVRVALAKAKTSDGVVIEVAGIIPVTNAMLGRSLGQVAEWEKIKANGETVRIDPPKEVVEQISAMTGEWPFAPLTGVISTPTMRPNGTILDVPGYDNATGLVLIGAPKMPAISKNPDKFEALGALEVLNNLLAEFPFADLPSKSVAFSMILTTVLRGALLPAVPMHVATAPQPGTGKSYLLDIASAIATGERCAVIAVAPNPEETEKRLIAAALAGRQIIALDNVSEMLSGDFLNQVTERPILQLRPLGTSNDVRLPNAFTVFANGNNLSAPADLVRRTLAARLDANLENPEERIFKANPVQTILADRGLYVAACLTIGRAYIAAGSPSPCPPLASFERWSNLVRSSLVWLGCPDPCASMDMARAEDPIRAARSAFFTSWAQEVVHTEAGFTGAQIVHQTENRSEIGFECPNFREAAIAVAADRSGNSVSPQRLGKWMNKNKNNVIAKLKLVCNVNDPTRPRWRLKAEP